MAQQSRAALQADINTKLADNSVEAISAQDTRETQTDLNDSNFNLTTDDSDDITEGATNLFKTAAEAAKLANISVSQAVDLDSMESDISTNASNIATNTADIAALANGMTYQGNWDASAGTFPGGGTAQTGYFYTVSVGGTVDSVVFVAEDRLIATTDNASTSTYSGNWTKLDATDAVTSVAGKTGNVTLDLDDVSDSATRLALTASTQDIDGAKTFTSIIRGEGGIDSNLDLRTKTASLSITESDRNKTLKFDVSGVTVITIDNTSAADFNSGEGFNVLWATDSGSNSLAVNAGGAQSIISKGSNLGLSEIGSTASCIYLGSNVWFLFGDLA